MVLELSDREARAIQIWAESIVHGGHWGDGDMAVPEEEILMRKLGTMEDNKLSISETEAKIILAWSDSTLGIYTLEEDSVIKKIKRLLHT
jgi:hypothetical protein